MLCSYIWVLMILQAVELSTQQNAGLTLYILLMGNKVKIPEKKPNSFSKSSFFSKYSKSKRTKEKKTW